MTTKEKVIWEVEVKEHEVDKPKEEPKEAPNPEKVNAYKYSGCYSIR